MADIAVLVAAVLGVSSGNATHKVRYTPRPMIYKHFMTVQGVAGYPGIKNRTIWELVANCELPGFTVRGPYRFRKGEIVRWARAITVCSGEPEKMADCTL